VVDVEVGVDHRRHRPLAPMPPVQGKPRGGGLLADQRVDHHDPAVDVGEVLPVVHRQALSASRNRSTGGLGRRC
jgi:hypothetical protein